MTADNISQVFRKNFLRTLVALGITFVFVAAILVAFFVSFGIKEAREQAQSVIRTYRNNLVSILILKEEQALDVAIERMNESFGAVQFRRDSSAPLSHLEYREEISTSGQLHGTLVYAINPLTGFNVGVLAASLGGLAASFLGVWFAFRRAQNELTVRVSTPLENLSGSILQARGGEDAIVSFSPTAESGAREILDLQSAFQRYNKKLIESQAVLSAARQDQAIARMTQMLAHDVRKPFSMFKAVVETIEQCESPEEMRLVTQEFIPEVNRAMSTITGLLQDVMEVSSQAAPQVEPTRPTALLETALVDVFAYQKDADVLLEYAISSKYGDCVTTFVSRRVRGK